MTPIACPSCGSWRKYHGSDWVQCGRCATILAVWHGGTWVPVMDRYEYLKLVFDVVAA